MFTESKNRHSPLQWKFFSRSFGWSVNYWKKNWKELLESGLQSGQDGTLNVPTVAANTHRRPFS